MTWLALSWYLLLGTANIQSAITEPGGVADWSTPSGAYVSTLGVGFVIAEHLHVSTFVRNYETHSSGLSFSPFRSDYGIDAHLSIGPLDVGIAHECDHPVESVLPVRSGGRYGRNDTTIYVRMSGTAKIF